MIFLMYRYTSNMCYNMSNVRRVLRDKSRLNINLYLKLGQLKKNFDKLGKSYKLEIIVIIF